MQTHNLPQDAIHEAFEQGNIPLIEELSRSDPSLLKRYHSIDGTTPLVWAAKNNQNQVAEWVQANQPDLFLFHCANSKFPFQYTTDTRSTSIYVEQTVLVLSKKLREPHDPNQFLEFVLCYWHIFYTVEDRYVPNSAQLMQRLLDKFKEVNIAGQEESRFGLYCCEIANDLISGKFSNADVILEKLVKEFSLSPNELFAIFVNRIGVIYDSGLEQLDQAFKCYNLALTLCPSTNHETRCLIYSNLACIYRQQNDLENAKAVLAKCAMEYPDLKNSVLAEANRHLAKEFEVNKQYSEAIKYYKLVFDTAPTLIRIDSMELYKKIVICYLKENDTINAEAILAKGVKACEGKAGDKTLIDVMLQACGIHAEFDFFLAEKLVQVILSISPGNKDASLLLFKAWIYSKKILNDDTCATQANIVFNDMLADGVGVKNVFIWLASQIERTKSLLGSQLCLPSASLTNPDYESASTCQSSANVSCSSSNSSSSSSTSSSSGSAHSIEQANKFLILISEYLLLAQKKLPHKVEDYLDKILLTIMWTIDFPKELNWEKFLLLMHTKINSNEKIGSALLYYYQTVDDFDNEERFIYSILLDRIPQHSVKKIQQCLKLLEENYSDAGDNRANLLPLVRFLSDFVNRLFAVPSTIIGLVIQNFIKYFSSVIQSKHVQLAQCYMQIAKCVFDLPTAHSGPYLTPNKKRFFRNLCEPYFNLTENLSSVPTLSSLVANSEGFNQYMAAQLQHHAKQLADNQKSIDALKSDVRNLDKQLTAISSSQEAPVLVTVKPKRVYKKRNKASDESVSDVTQKAEANKKLKTASTTSSSTFSLFNNANSQGAAAAAASVPTDPSIRPL